MSIEAVRGVEELDARIRARQARLDEEIASAKAGVVSKVSRAAAARYLAMSPTTLAKLIAQGKGPPFVQNQPTSRAKNQHMRFPWDDLVAWDRARSQYASPQAKQDLLDEAKRNELRRKLAELEQQAQAVREALQESGDRRFLAFGSLADINQPHPWVLDGALLAGHALTVPPEVLEEGDIDWLTVEEALVMDWSDLTEQKRWLDVLLATMEKVGETAQAWYRRMVLMEQVRGKRVDDA